MSETLMNTSNPLAGERIGGTVGFALPGIAVRIGGDDGVLGVGKIGEIEVCGPNVFKGYWRMPDKTAEEFGRDGFFRTGDLGVMDSEGRVSIAGRTKDLIISGGYNVYPKEVETLMDEMPEVSESAVIGVPHPDFGEGVVAVVVPRDEPVDTAMVRGGPEGQARAVQVAETRGLHGRPAPQCDGPRCRRTHCESVSPTCLRRMRGRWPAGPRFEAE